MVDRLHVFGDVASSKEGDFVRYEDYAELLEALEAMVFKYDMCNPDTQYMKADAMKAIAKAKGE